MPGDLLSPDPAARGGTYALLARAFVHPDERLHDALESGTFAAHLADFLDQTTLDVSIDSAALTTDSTDDGAALTTDSTDDGAALITDDDYETLSARFNDVFAIGFSEYDDPTDGSMTKTEPAVPLYESTYRPNASWTDVNLDLARAYDYYDLEIDRDFRDNHDHLRYELEFAGYLARREASVDGDDAGLARLDFLDRHLRVLVEGVEERIADEPGVGVYGELVSVLAAFSAADREDLVDRLEE